MHVISDDFSRVAKNELYGSSQLEKTARGELKSGVERHLTPGGLAAMLWLGRIEPPKVNAPLVVYSYEYVDHL